jgi:hypothetical protein
MQPRHIKTLKAVLESLEGRLAFSNVSVRYVIEVLKNILALYESEMGTTDPAPFNPADVVIDPEGDLRP